MAKGKLPTKVHIKAQRLMHEGKSRLEAYGEAAGMNRSGRLNEKGEYRHVKKKKH